MQVLEVAINNAFILQQIDAVKKQKAILQFRLELIRNLVQRTRESLSIPFSQDSNEYLQKKYNFDRKVRLFDDEVSEIYAIPDCSYMK